MRLAYVTPELHPLVKTGGLGDVAGALTRALAAAGHSVRAYLPAYTSVLGWCRTNGLKPRYVELPFAMEVAGRSYPLVFGELAWHGVQLVLVGNDAFFARPHPYLDEHKQDYPDNLARFAFFCRAVAEHLIARGGECDVLHLNDWQTSLLAAYCNTQYAGRLPAGLSTVLTIHNLGYQGSFPVEDFAASGLDWRHFTPDEFEFYGRANLLKGGIRHADAVTTVSPTYAEQIQTPEYGHGLDGVLRAAQGKLTGILNGIDTAEWNPATDPHLPDHYSVDDLAGKTRCKALLQRRLGLPVRPRTLLLGCVSRFDRQKGINLIIDAFAQLALLDVQLVLLGSGHPKLEADARHLAQRYPQQVAVQVGFDEALAHQIEAGADIFLMPSLYEPCGLNQLYSQRYGTLPLVRATGGLADTVDDGVTGFSFDEPSAAALVTRIQRAARLYFTDRKRFNTTVRQAMLRDNGWARRAGEYEALYAALAAQATAHSIAAAEVHP
jgi:starch synthase